jgi:ribosomal protein S18 acetylase RimI-like enzyme
MKTTFKECGVDDAGVLQKISEQTYYDAFKDFTSKETMQQYLTDAFSVPKLKQELANPHSKFYLLYADDTLAGYLKINRYDAQTHLNDACALEVERIYLIGSMQKKGLGHLLMNKAIEFAIEAENIEYIWLGVWDKNEDAIAFYEKNGFQIVGMHPFYMGHEEQSDYIMRKDLY